MSKSISRTSILINHVGTLELILVRDGCGLNLIHSTYNVHYHSNIVRFRPKDSEEDTTIDSMVLIVLVLTNVSFYTSALEFE